jgi:type I restriction enzyme R subunit
MTVQSEKILEEKMIMQLIANGYERAFINNEEELEINFKKQLEIHNMNNLIQLGKTGFTEQEFDRILTHLKGGSIFDKAKKIRDRHLIKFDDGKECYITFMNTEKWCKNTFQVTSQITMEGMYKNRYDVTLLINGLPLVQIELKRRGKELQEAFRQICRYQKHSFKGLFKYVQIFILSNGVNTKYFANNKELNYKQTFFWTDEKNKKFADLDSFTSEFLEKCHISKMIARYIVLNETSKDLMVLRPYQYYAVEKIIESVENNAMKNGYIWHTTGSGKTLTSFKASQLIATMNMTNKIDKVVFCVDRHDLDFNTMKEFNAFSPNSVDSTANTKQLKNKLLDEKTTILITTMQKLNNLVSQSKYYKELDDVRHKRMVFIFDECHRSQFGDSHKRIDKFFTNKQFFGFTGTPIFKENANKNRTTEDLFGNKLHSYIIKDAIADDNVLGFSVDYYSTFEGKRELYDETTGMDKTYEQVSAINKKEVFYDDRRLNAIVDHILATHDTNTKQKKFTAMFAVCNQQTLMKYYELFKKKSHNLKIATIFSYGANENITVDGRYDPENDDLSTPHSREKLDEFVDDYNQMFGESFDLKKYNGFNAYYIDISKKVKDRRIDILLVVNMFLTGFDSKYLNTLYTDKNLNYHGLIQAYSRTNRILDDSKKFGRIINFRNLSYNTDEAIKLFSDEDAISTVIMKPYKDYLKLANEAIDRLMEHFGDLDLVKNLQSENDKAMFIKMFREVVRSINTIDIFNEFAFSDLNMTEQAYEDYKSEYYEIYESTKNKEKDEPESILDEIDYEIHLLRRDHINVDYILRLLNELDKNKESFENDKEFIIKQVESIENLRSKKELVKEFLEQTNFIDNKEIDEEFENFMQAKKQEEIVDSINKYNLKEKEFIELIKDYQYVQKLNRYAVKNSLNDLVEGIDYKKSESAFRARKKKTDIIYDLIKYIVEKYEW